MVENNNGDCADCRKLTNSQKWLIFTSFFMFFTSIYGIIILIKNLISLF